MLPATPTPTACATPYQDVSVIRAPVPHYPDSARALGLGPVVVTITVTVGPDGKAKAANLTVSSNNMAIDEEARQEALHTTYAPKVVQCKAVVGSYDMRISFSL